MSQAGGFGKRPGGGSLVQSGVANEHAWNPGKRTLVGQPAQVQGRHHDPQPWNLGKRTLVGQQQRIVQGSSHRDENERVNDDQRVDDKALDKSEAHDDELEDSEEGEADAVEAPTRNTGGKRRRTTEKGRISLYAKDPEGRNLPPSVQDVNQGQVGDCYLFAAMAAIVDTDPNLIKKMIKFIKKRTYWVHLDGIDTLSQFQPVTTTFEGKHGEIGPRGAFWPLLIEKAYMKHKGGFSELNEGGRPGDAIKDLTDKDSREFDPRKMTYFAVLTSLAWANAKKQPITLSTPDDFSGEKKPTAEDHSIYHNHAYAVVDVDKKKGQAKLYNPWGDTHPNGNGWVSVTLIRTLFNLFTIND